MKDCEHSIPHEYMGNAEENCGKIKCCSTGLYCKCVIKLTDWDE